MTTDASHLHQLLDQAFNEEELRTLCFDLDVDYDNLGGRDKAANARELVQRLQREGRLADLLTLARHRRPHFPWPDPPPPVDPAAAAARQAQAQALRAQSQRLLAPRVRNPASRDALFSEAFFPAHEWVLDQIDFAGAAAVFLPRCWQTLSQLAPDGSLHTRLLLTLRLSYGHPEQGQIDDLIVAWQQVCAAQLLAQAAERPSAAQPAPVRPGQPTLFLSYADRDAGLARRLAADLAAYGHACRLERAPKTDNAAWLAETAVGLGSSYAVLLLVGGQTATDRWQRLEYLAARDRQKVIIPIRLHTTTAVPPFIAEAPVEMPPVLPATDKAADGWAALLDRLPPPPPPARQAWAKEASVRQAWAGPDWVSESDALRLRLPELAYMDRLKLAELQHVAQYTRLSGQAEIRRSPGGRLELHPVVARQEFCHTPWQPEREVLVTQRRFADAVAELKAIRRAVLLGDPGSGKTTTFYKLAADLIETALVDAVAPIPLMVRLGLWTDAAEPFLAFLRRSVGELGEGLAERLAEGRAALLLDGINELPANQQTVKYQAVRDFLAKHPHLLAWVSCREQDYPSDRDLRLDRVTVAPLDAVRMQEFIHNYLDGLPDFGRQAAADLFWQLAGEKAQATHRRFMADLGPKLADPERTFWLDGQLPDGLEWGWRRRDNSYWEDWLKERARPASLLLLATNPYMLYMLLQVYQDKRAVPDNRGQLFDWFVERLLLREGLFTWDETTETVVQQVAGQALLAGLTELAYEMQRRSAANRKAGALTALPLAAAAAILDKRQRYQAASANLLSLGDEVRFTHQLLQEYFVARAMRERIFGLEEEFQRGPVLSAVEAGAKAQRLRAETIWLPKSWWEPTNWEEATILLAGLYSDNCTPVLLWLAEAQPELAARCIVESGAHTPEATKLRLREEWLPRLTDLRRDPDARARAAVGRALGRVALEDDTPLDKRSGVGFVLRNGLKIPDIAWGTEIQAKNYTVGGDKDAWSSLPEQTVPIVHPYRLSRYPITNSQFNCFITAPDFGDGRWWRGMPDRERQIDNTYFPPYANSPHERVSWYQAVAFCRWLSDKLGYTVELPHEYEWEVAARWPDGRFYPWGNEFDTDRANTYEGSIGQPTAVGLYPASELGLYDLSGNVWEWCRNKYEKRDEEQVDESNDGRVLRGGSFNLNADDARAAYRRRHVPGHRSSAYGFRVVVVVRRSPSHHDH